MARLPDGRHLENLLMRLTDLDPQWVADYTPTSHRVGDDLTIETAQGILFDDPQGDGSILAWFRGRGVPDDADPGPGRWSPTGTGFADLSLMPSIDLSCGGKYPGRWHGWVTDGEVR